MHNIAIILGVSAYENAEDLPACKNDVEKMYQLLDATDKYNILKIEQDSTKSSVIKEIEHFLKANNDEDAIGEILFYFSGHGYQDEAGLHYILKHTEMGRINVTSLNNDELDNLIRGYNPQLFVKIIDACQSGLNYIKSINHDDIVDNNIVIKTETEKELHNCIFMSSSKSNESSIATDECSLFTEVFISSVLDEISTDVIRYSDIQNYVRDVFNTNKYMQTPFFSMQCDGREIFTIATDKIKILANSWSKKSGLIQEEEREIEIKLDRFLNAYRIEDEVKEIIDKIYYVISQEKLPLSWLDKYYDVKLDDTQKSGYREDSGIVKFLYERRDKENLYVEFETERVKKENILGIPLYNYETVPVGFSTLVHSLPSNIRINLSPKNKGLPRYDIELVFVYSDTGMYIFQGVKQYVFKGWEQYVLWDTKRYTYKRLDYEKFDEADWKHYVHKQLEDSADYVENSLNDYVSSFS